jgi:hypothetical protein
MSNRLSTKRLSLIFRSIIFLSIFAILPFAIYSLIAPNDVLKGGMWFFIALFILLVPELFINLVLIPFAVQFAFEQLSFNYLYGVRKSINITQVLGYSTTKESTNLGILNGIILYLSNRQKIRVSEMNFKSITPLINYLNEHQIKNYGTDEIRPWLFPTRYKYD